ncbi:MAG: YdcF family protein [Pseudomonadota bacterium]
MNRRWSFLIIVLLLSIALADFLGFCQRAARSRLPTNPSADAIVILTGGGGLRIAAGLELIEAGSAPKALISGVNPDITVDEMVQQVGGDAASYECCVEFGYAARSTAGNAIESAEWVRSNEYESIILVTSDYHMPRSLILLGKTLPEAELIPYPVRSRINAAAPLSSAQSFRGLAGEWLKWRVTNLRYGRAI